MWGAHTIMIIYETGSSLSVVRVSIPCSFSLLKYIYSVRQEFVKYELVVKSIPAK